MEKTHLSIDILSAGAGSGKTYTLTQRLSALLERQVRPEGILATTFTQKAAAELQERVRVRLLEAGRTDAANALGSALIGTVHSIGIRLLQRFAFEAGVSPLVEVIDEADGQRLFNEALAQVLDEARVERMNELADRLGLTKKSYGDPYDWRSDVRSITDVARANNFSQAVLLDSKKRSWESFQALLPPVQNTDALTWNNRLTALLDQTIAALEDNDADTTKTTRDAVAEWRTAQHRLMNNQGLDWYEWVKIGKARIAAKSKDLAESLFVFVRSHDEHAGFQSDVREFIERVFDIAIDALDEFQTYKKKRGLIDYTDMEAYIIKLLRRPDVQEVLRGELDLLLVDEFQDTSPIQLDIFLQLSRLARHSIWVGDPKQSIYGFRGAEPALMDAIATAVGGVRPENILNRSWRSRPDLVYAVNAIFTRAFPGMPPGQVALEPAFTPEQEAEMAYVLKTPLPDALQHWHFKNETDERKAPKEWFYGAVAEQIFVALERAMPVFDKGRQSLRPMRPGDVAVLCRSNQECLDMAEALSRAGLKASIARNGLLETPEARLVMACLKYLLSAQDALSVAEILVLTGAQPLDELVRDRVDWLFETQPSDQRPRHWAAGQPRVQRLQALRPQVADLSASEALNLLLDELDLRRVAAAMGDAHQRLDNLDALRKLALDYESACTRLHAAASLSGFLLWLGDLSARGLDAQGSSENPGAVNVLTYHKSKGLEFPMTVCMSMDQPLREKIWGINLVTDAPPDLSNILANRWIRFWVNPYGDQWNGTRLKETLAESDIWQNATRQALEEEARLLYVGLTRARDYLVFPTTLKGTPWLNRVFHRGDSDMPTLDPHQSETPFEWAGRWLNAQTDIIWTGHDAGVRVPAEAGVLFPPEPRGRAPFTRLPHRIDHLNETPPMSLRTGVPTAFASWLPFKGELPEAAHLLLRNCFCAPLPELRDVVDLQLKLHPVEGALNAEAIFRQAGDFARYLNRTLDAGPMVRHTQYPLEGWYGQRWLKCKIDLLLESPEERIAVFIAPFADGMKKWPAVARPYVNTAAWAEWMFGQVDHSKRFKAWVVFPLEGQVAVYSSYE
ncbi:MAG: UvrD-helicase domain-containing protein [Saprospiraceae bacterium]|nr:UvrD-helicase domain-containing protein [Saprospiraceae bacterium]